MFRKRLRRARTAVVAATLVSLTAGALAVTPLGGSGAGAFAAPAKGIKVQPDLPEPPYAQFVEGQSPVISPKAAPATDIRSAPGTTPGTGRTTGGTAATADQLAAAATGTYTCPGFSTIDDPNPVENLYKDLYTWGNYAPYKVGNGSGNINWRLNPYANPSWYMWFHSLRWLGQGIIAGAAGDRAALDRVTTVVRDWTIDNPYSWKGDVGAYEATFHRTNVLICTRQAILSGLEVTTLPSTYAWLDKALTDHATFLLNNWSGAWNHGTDESIALFGVGCTLDRSDYKTTAQNRLAAGITTAIDAQGSTNEQSTAYAQFNYSLWGRAASVLEQCGADPGTTITQRRALMANWLALATNSRGIFHQVGDSELVKAYPWPGTPAEYAGSLGTKGTAPTQRVGIFSAGYVFGRTGWGETRPFTGESSYSIRYGPSRAMHGHSDHMAVTYVSRGRDILIDAGHPGYTNNVWRVWAKGPTAHSSMTTPNSADRLPVTKLNRYVVKPTWEFFEFSDAPGAGISRTRGVLVLKDPDLIVALDRGTSTTPQQFQTLWHLPSDQVATVYSRTTATAMAPGDTTRTIAFQIPYRQALPRGAILIKRAQTSPIQGWHYPTIFKRDAAPTLMFARAGYNASILSVIAPMRTSGSVLYTTRWSGSTFIVDLNVGGAKTSIGVSSGGGIFRIS
jgi:hypothetical protein